MVFGGKKTNFFLRKRWIFFPSKTIFFLGKTDFSYQNQRFPRKKMVLGQKKISPLGKTKRTNKKTTIVFGKLYGQTPKRCFFGFPWENLVFGGKNQLSPRKTMVFPSKTVFLLGRSWFFHRTPFFPRENKKNIESGCWVFQDIVFFFGFSLGKSWFFAQIHLFFLGKNLCFRKKRIFLLGKS